MKGTRNQERLLSVAIGVLGSCGRGDICACAAAVFNVESPLVLFLDDGQLSRLNGLGTWFVHTCEAAPVHV